MKLTLKFITIILASSMLQACLSEMNKQGGGTVIGTVTGGILGSRFGKGQGTVVAAGIGALAGALIGGQIGKTMDEQDKRLLELSSQKALELSRSGTKVEWHNPDNDNHGYVIPTKPFKDDYGQYCREYTQVIIIGGKREEAYGRACRKADGHWEIVK